MLDHHALRPAGGAGCIDTVSQGVSRNLHVRVLTISLSDQTGNRQRRKGFAVEQRPSLPDDFFRRQYITAP